MMLHIVGRDRAASSSVDTKRVKRDISRISDEELESEEEGRTKHHPNLGETDTDDGQTSTPQPLGEDDTTDEDMPTPPNVKWGDREQHSSKKAYNSPMAQRQSPPLRRELPFTRVSESRNGAVGSLPHQQDNALESAGETDDDEL